MTSRKYLKWLLGFMVILILPSCYNNAKSSKKEDKYKIETDYFEDGKIWRQGRLHEDSTIVDTVRSYYHNGRLEILKQCRSFYIWDGTFIKYDSMGHLLFRTTFKNDTENGINYSYTNGKLDWAENIVNGEIEGGLWYYDTIDGHIKSYTFRGGISSYFKRYYNKDSTLCKQSGSILSHYTVISDQRIDSFRKNTNIHFQIMVPMPPYTKRQIDIQIKDTTDKLLNDTHLYNDSIIIDWYNKFANNGWYRIFVKATLYDLKDNEEKSDSIVIPIIIGPNPNRVDIF